MTAYQLHDSESEEILGIIIVIKETSNTFTELFEGWEEFNKLEEHEQDPKNIYQFISWFNEEYETQIEILDLQFIQP